MAYARRFTKMTQIQHEDYLRKLSIVETFAVSSLLSTAKKKRIGRGAFSSVYDGPNEGQVIRFSTSTAESDFLHPCSAPYFSEATSSLRPKVFDFCEELNNKLFDMTNERGIPSVAVVIMEKLERFKDRSLCYHANKLLSMLVSHGDFARVAAIPVAYDEKYVKKWLQHPLFKNFDTYAEQLSLFCADYSLVVDKISHDLMVRPGTGELVICDPTFSRGD